MAEAMRRHPSPLLAVVGGAHIDELKQELSDQLDVLIDGTAWDEKPLTSPVALGHRGIDLLNRGNTQEALQHLEKAVGLRPDFLSIHIYLGTAHYDLGQYHRAIEVYRRLVHELPNYADARFNLAWNLYLAGDPEPAALERTKAIALDPKLERIAWPPEAVKPRLTVEPLANLRDEVSQWLDAQGWPKAALGMRIVIGVIAAAIESFITPIPVLLPAWVAAHRKPDRAFARQSIPAFHWATAFGLVAGLSLIPGLARR